MMNRNFNDWISKFKTSISDYTYYVDFEKIYKKHLIFAPSCDIILLAADKRPHMRR